MPETAIQLWHIALDTCVSSGLLSEEERTRAARLRFARDRHRWVAGRAALRAILGQQLDCPPQDVSFAYSPYGKPRLASDSDHARLRFNLSHSGDAALLAITEGWDVGVDIESLRRDFDPLDLAQSVFAPEEILRLQDTAPAERHAFFLTLWTGKEAILKAHGAGLSLAPEQFSIADFGQNGKSAAHGFTVHRLKMGTEQAAALAIEAENPRFYHYQWHG